MCLDGSLDWQFLVWCVAPYMQDARLCVLARQGSKQDWCFIQHFFDISQGCLLHDFFVLFRHARYTSVDEPSRLKSEYKVTVERLGTPRCTLYLYHQ